MEIVVELNTWQELFRNSWAGALDTLREIEKQGREEEALDILEDIFNPDVCGKIPSETEVNDYIWFELADDMNLYCDDDEDDEDDDMNLYCDDDEDDEDDDDED